MFNKPIEELIPEELYQFRNSHECDEMGFDNLEDKKEGVDSAEHSD